MAYQNYKKIFAVKAEYEKRIAEIAPGIPRASGIYVFYRTDEAGIRRAYCGQAVKLLDRCASHLAEYDHIALSLKKHKFYNTDNPTGWKLRYKEYPTEQLDEMEVAMIRRLADSGYQMYNVTAGSQGKGKQVTGQYKPPRTYSEGFQSGKRALAKELSGIAEKHLTIAVRDDKKGNKVSERQRDKFMELINIENYEEGGNGSTTHYL